MSSVSNAARRRILLACFVMSLFTFAATIKFNRHCSICSKPVKVENALTLGVLGYLDDFDIIHESCMAVWNGNGDILNFFSLELLNSDSQKHSG
ncbi:MAG TPA: hypothetical protein DEB70_12210 [Planctomycetaceae bacterium]|nr:hypothetical protein [Planctomycetaceae bacterium]|tara:strand:- start:189 stop:470 length:282 start_codon:yes stop_codon:yes gene_type:complete